MTKVLIIDDSGIELEIIKCQVASAGFDVVSSHDPKQALQMVKDCKPDIIILDIVMREMNGFEVCAELKSDPETNHIPVMFVSSSRNEENLIKGMHLGIVDFISKPVDRNELVKSIRIHDHMHKINQSLKEMVSKL